MTNTYEKDLIDDPCISFWLKGEIRKLDQRDILGALRDAELLVQVCQQRFHSQINHSEHPSIGDDKIVAALDPKLPLFAQLAEHSLNRKKASEKNILIKVEALTARMMIENEKNVLGL